MEWMDKARMTTYRSVLILVSLVSLIRHCPRTREPTSSDARSLVGRDRMPRARAGRPGAMSGSKE